MTTETSTCSRRQRPEHLWRNDGTGPFTDSGQALGSDESRAVTLGDVEGDGDLDVSVGDWSVTSDNYVFTNDSGLAQPRPSPPEQGQPQEGDQGGHQAGAARP